MLAVGMNFMEVHDDAWWQRGCRHSEDTFGEEDGLHGAW